MKIAFVSCNREKLPDAVLPLGLLYVMQSTPDAHTKVLIDLCFESEPERVLSDALTEAKPDLVALGMRNIQNNDYSGLSDNVQYYADLMRAVRASCSAPVILGGSGFSVIPMELMARLRPDFGISGEAEGAFPRLVELLERGDTNWDEVGSLYRWDGERVVRHAPAGGFLDLSTLTPPDRSIVDPRYYEHYGLDAIQTKRGCPLLCDYCTYPTIEGRVGRLRDPVAVVDEMFQALEVQPGARHFFIVDSVFNLPPPHAKQICRELIDRGWSIPWTCYTNPLGFDRELADLAREAGCAGMEVGSDSGCEDVLLRLRKGFTLKHVRRLHDICRDARVPDCHTFILGTRGETLDDVERTLDFIVDLDPFSAILMIWTDDLEALDPELRASRLDLRHAIEERLRERAKEQPLWTVPELGVNFSEKLFRQLRRSGRHGPLWQHMRDQLEFARR